MSKEMINSVGFVRPDALVEEVSTKVVKVIKDEVKSKADVIKVVDLQTKQEEVACPSYITQYYG